MAIERAIVPFLSYSSSPCSSYSSATKVLFLNPKTSSHFSVNTNPNRFGFTRRRFKCWAEYDRDYFNNNSSYPKPAEIEWNKELCNTVHLIGVVGVAVEIKHLPSGKVLAWTSLAVKKSPSDTYWINLTFWGELANAAFQHVQKGQQIYVRGRLVADTVNDDGKQQTHYKVFVQQINFVEKKFSSSTVYDNSSDSNGPGRKAGNHAGLSNETTEQLWQAFFANPVDWWDNRKTKRNPKYPDFKHKDTGESLWVEGRKNPTWVKSQIAILDARMGSFNNQDSRMEANLMAGDSFLQI